MNFPNWTPQPWWPYPFPPIAGGDQHAGETDDDGGAPASPTEANALLTGIDFNKLPEKDTPDRIQTFRAGETIQVPAGTPDPYGRTESFPRLFTFPDPSARRPDTTADEINKLAISLMISAARQGKSLDFPTATARAEDLLGLAATQSGGGVLSADQSARLEFAREELGSLDQYRKDDLAEQARSNTIALLAQTQNYATVTAQLSQKERQFDSNLGLLQDRLDLDRAQGDATLALQTRAQIERENARLADNLLQRQALNAEIQQFRQGLNAQVQTGNADRSLVAAESALARATTLLGLQSGDEQFRLREERALLSDIANMAVNAGDVGRQAAFLEAGSTGISQALAGGETGFTGESLRPLNESLGLLDRLRQPSGALQGGLADVITQPSAVERVETVDPNAGQVPLLQTNGASANGASANGDSPPPNGACVPGTTGVVNGKTWTCNSVGSAIFDPVTEPVTETITQSPSLAAVLARDGSGEFGGEQNRLLSDGSRASDAEEAEMNRLEAERWADRLANSTYAADQKAREEAYAAGVGEAFDLAAAAAPAAGAVTGTGDVVSSGIQALLDAAPEFADFAAGGGAGGGGGGDAGGGTTIFNPYAGPGGDMVTEPPPASTTTPPANRYTGPAGVPLFGEGGITGGLMAIIGDPQEDGAPNPELVIGNPNGPGFQVIPLKDLPKMTDGGFVGFHPDPGSGGGLAQLLGNDGSNRATNFLGSALQQALRRQNLKKVRTPVQGATPGRSAFLNERDAGLAALLGIQPRIFEEERRKALPTGISEGIVRRTA